MAVTDQQVRKLLMEYQKTGVIGTAAMKAGMDRKTAAGYVECGQLPPERMTERNWRTKPDPFEGYWPEVESKLRKAPELEAKALFEGLAQHAAALSGLQAQTPLSWVQTHRRAQTP